MSQSLQLLNLTQQQNLLFSWLNKKKKNLDLYNIFIVLPVFLQGAFKCDMFCNTTKKWRFVCFFIYLKLSGGELLI